MVCYRRQGHNEGDDPSYTQPLMYKAIAERRSVRKLFVEALVKRGELTLDEAEETLADFQRRLQVALDETRQSAPAPTRAAKPPAPQGRAAPRRDRRRPRRARRGVRPPDRLPARLHAPPQAGQAVRDQGQAVPRGRRGRVGDGRGAGLRLAGARGHGHPPGRRGQPPGHVQPAPRHPDRLRDGAGLDAAERPARRHGQVPRLRLPAVGVRRGRVRVRLLGRQQGRAGAVGGAVRRLRQRRPDHHRPVPGGRRGQVGPDLGPRPAAAPRLRGPGSRALERPHRALPDPRRRGQHPGLQRHDRGAVLPPAAAPDPPGRPQAAGAVHAQAAAAHEGDPLADRGPHPRLVPGGARRSVDHRSAPRCAA